MLMLMSFWVPKEGPRAAEARGTDRATRHLKSGPKAMQKPEPEVRKAEVGLGFRVLIRV